MNKSNSADVSVRRVFREEEEETRTKAIYKLYLNPSQADRDLYLYHMEEPTGLDRLFGRHRQRRLDILNRIGEHKYS